MLLSPQQRQRSSRRWLWGAGVVACGTLVFGVCMRPFVQDPMPAEWLALSGEGVYIRRDSLAYYAYPLAGLAVWAGALGLTRWAPRAADILAPLPARVALLLTVMCSNIAVLGWLRPTTFSAWLGLVYMALAVGLVANHFRAQRILRPALSTPAEKDQP